jgi:diacylglycerol kinase family enzyme
MGASFEVIVNTSAGSADKTTLLDKLTERLREDSRWRISLANSGAKLLALANQAARRDSQTIVAAGGDGTVNTVASVLVGTTKNLGILPMGTLNHFAKDLNVPTDIEAAIQTIEAGNIVTVDAGEVNGLIFINNSSLGLYPSIVTERQKQQRLGAGKWPAFLWAAVAVLRRYPFVDVRLNIENVRLERRTPFVFIGNNRYEMEGLNVGARLCLSGGELSLYITNQMSRLGLLRLAFRALFGRLNRDEDLTTLCAPQIWINTPHHHVRVALDGEVRLLNPPLHYRVLPKALRVLAPTIVN